MSLTSVEFNTLEKHEDTIYVQHAKLFRFSKELAEWKERGEGDIKLLLHKQKGTVRLLMHRDYTMTICANHNIDRTMGLSFLSDSDNKSVVYNCPGDFTDEEAKMETFAIRFASRKEASDFRQIFTESQRNNEMFGNPYTRQIVGLSQIEKEKKKALIKEEELMFTLDNMTL